MEDKMVHMALISGLVVTAGAPRKTAIQLMLAAGQECLDENISLIFLVADTEKNRRRPFYRHIGFSEAQKPEDKRGQGNGSLLAADAKNAVSQLKRRLKGQ